MNFHLKTSGDNPIIGYMTSQGAGGLLDTTLIGQDGEVRCHSVIILHNVFDYLRDVRGDITIVLPDFKVHDLEQMLLYCYTGRCFSKAPELLSPLLSVLKLVDSFTETDVSAPYEVSSAVAEEVSPTGNKKAQPMGSKEAPAMGNKKLKAASRMVSSAPGSMMSSYAACKIMSSDTANSMPLAAAEEVSSAIMEIQADKESSTEQVLNDDIEDVLVNSENSIAVKNVRVLNPVSTISKTSVMANKPNCDYCDRVFTSRKSLTRHIEEYHLRKPNLLNCDFCKVTFRRKEHFENHLKSKGCLKNKGLIFECKFCKNTFSSPEKVKTHMNKNCLKKYFCSICLKFFSKQKDLKSHAH